MKKIALTLLAVLVLGTFVACNSEVDSLLWEEGEKTLNLSFGDQVQYSFSPVTTVTEKSFTVPDSVRTWQDLIDMNFSVTYYAFGAVDPVEMHCMDPADYIWFSNFLLTYPNSGDAVTHGEIDFNTTYLLAEQPA